MNHLRKFILISIACIQFGCQSGGVLLKEMPLNISESRRVISTVIGTPRLISENGRELFSAYYDRRGREIDNMVKAKERLQTVVIILGDRRPYDIQVQVLVESKVEDNSFRLTERDEKAATKVANRIKEALYQSHNNRNVIDDFRPL